MPRSRGRFSRLNRELRASGASATSGRAGEYLNWLKGVNKINVTRRPSQAYMQRFNVGVIPFGVSPKTGASELNHVITSMTVQADAIKATVTGATDAKLGIERDLTKIREESGFYPAQAKVLLVGASAQTETETSGITKQPYKTIKGRSGSIPYGRTTTGVVDAETGAAEADIGTVDELDIRNSLAREVFKKGTTVGSFKIKTVTFVSEEWKLEQLIGVVKPTNAPTTLPA